MKNFSAVEFTDEKITEVIPSKWLTPGKQNSLWPDYKGFKMKRALTGKYDFNDGKWDLVPVKLLASADTYEEARIKLTNSEAISSFNSLPTEKRRKKKQKLASSSESSVDVESLLEDASFQLSFGNSSNSEHSSDPTQVYQLVQVSSNGNPCSATLTPVSYATGESVYVIPKAPEVHPSFAQNIQSNHPVNQGAKEAISGCAVQANKKNVDCRGVTRGACQDCDCNEYERSEADTKCCYCFCPPTKHKRLENEPPKYSTIPEHLTIPKNPTEPVANSCKNNNANTPLGTMSTPDRLFDYLTNIGVDHELAEILKGEGFDEESFQLLDDETLKVLIPKAGPRLKFKSMIQSFSSSATASEPTKESFVINDLSQSRDSFNVQSTNSSKVQPRSSSILPSTNIFNLHSTNNQQQLQEIKTFDLKETINKRLPDIYTKLVAEDTKHISYLDKLRLNRVVCDAFISINGCKPSTLTKLQLAKEIVTTFPLLKTAHGEGHEQWFRPGINGRASTGCIEQRFRNYRMRNLSKVEKEEMNCTRRRLGIDSIVGHAPKPTNDEDTSVRFVNISTDFTQKQNWLLMNDQPPSQVIEYMKDTFEGRRHLMKNETVKDILNEWPKLLNPEIIENEFKLIYGQEKGDSLLNQFPLLSKKIILQAKNCGRKQAEELANSIVFDDISTSSIQSYALVLLPLLLPRGMINAKKNSKKKPMRPTVLQSLDHFIKFIPIGETVEDFLKKDQDEERLQPYIVAVGLRSQPVQTFVVIEDKILETKSLLNAVDICFKLFFIFNLEFPPFCRNVWIFLNEAFYNCNDITNFIPACVYELKYRLF